MRKNVIVGGALAVVLGLTIAGCGNTPASTTTDDTTTPTQEQSGEFDAVQEYYGQWHGYVKTTGESVYGTAGGVEPMLDVYLEEDGSCSVEPTEAHADLLTDEGTWEAEEGKITMHLTDGDIVMTVTDDTAEAAAADFGIADFDTILFDFYG